MLPGLRPDVRVHAPITRLIRDGRGPFRNITASGTHVHHAVPGLILLIVGALTAIGGPGSLGWLAFAGVAVGIGMSLVLDEFALILHLQDVYWSGEGQLSVEAVTLTATCLGLALVGFSPFGIQGASGIERSVRLSATVLLLIDGVFSVACALKGKYRCALFGLFLPPVAWVGAVRLGRPASIWPGTGITASGWSGPPAGPPRSTAGGHRSRPTGRTSSAAGRPRPPGPPRLPGPPPEPGSAAARRSGQPALGHRLSAAAPGRRLSGQPALRPAAAERVARRVGPVHDARRARHPQGQGAPAGGRGSRGRPSIRSAIMFRWISSVPPAIR